MVQQSVFCCCYCVWSVCVQVSVCNGYQVSNKLDMSGKTAILAFVSSVLNAALACQH